VTKVGEKMENKNHAFQFCNECNQEVLIDNEVKLHSCSECGRPLKPCSICKANSKTVPGWDGCKRSCPFQKEFIDKYNEWEKK